MVFRNDVEPAAALDLVCDTEGEIDIVTEVSPADAERVKDSEHANLVTIDAMRVVSGLVNRNAAPMDDVRVRRALNLAVDRGRLIREVFFGFAHPVAAMAPPYSWESPDDLEPYPHDPEEGKRLLAEAGWPEGRALRLATTGDVEAVARYLAEGFKDSLGIEVDLVEISDEELVAAQRALVEKNLPVPFDVLVHAWFDLAAGYPPAVIHREYFHSGGAFRAGPVIPEFEDLMGRSITETDPGKLGEIGKELDKLVFDEALNVFLCCPQALVAVNKYVDFTGHAATLELAETEVGEEHWSRRNGG
ncbi:MAG: ABC transporter, substrate-binding protein (cluster 5, nickel/peptides/opines) [uncultured Rubrobacteraceae bacterium]|uniref:ABC transporter, substrate-binding protein (Cluster 5, nickel/peptides/opines) n=1 Tax=uncultured Rubrobacteraceae bacterium TaxID=349277 RepID=A0A6J4PKV9_9ACTN|nr:MAG: ABC transporter, substrate-binding protein (cluster 5, nickel/peptides/opines) [uncultured Rubrobacteraceae bacterium]